MCICVRRRFREPDYKLECGVCVNPCVVQFLSLDAIESQGASEGRLEAMIGEEDKREMKEDLKKLLLEEFFKEVISN